MNAKIIGMNAKIIGVNAKIIGVNAKIIGMNARLKTDFLCQRTNHSATRLHILFIIPFSFFVNAQTTLLLASFSLTHTFFSSFRFHSLSLDSMMAQISANSNAWTAWSTGLASNVVSEIFPNVRVEFPNIKFHIPQHAHSPDPSKSASFRSGVEEIKDKVIDLFESNEQLLGMIFGEEIPEQVAYKFASAMQCWYLR